MRQSARIPAVLLLFLSFSACPSEPVQPPPPSAVPAPAASQPPPAAARAPAPTDAGGGDALVRKSKLAPAPTDGLSLADRMERRKAEEARLAAQLAADERKRLLTWDRTKLKLHTEVFGSIQKTRAAYDGAKSKADVEKLRRKLEKPIAATVKKMHLIDPKGGNSNVLTDYDVMLNALAGDYPEALVASFDGQKAPLEEQQAELDKRTKKIEDWLAALRAPK
jgi:hypothetical protein